MSVRTNDTMQEKLQVLLKDVMEMKLTPDADLEWIIQLETFILQKAREPLDKMAQAGLTQAPPSMAGAGGGMGPMSQPPGMGGSFQGEGPGMGGMRVPPPQPMGDEMNRMLALPPQ